MSENKKINNNKNDLKKLRKEKGLSLSEVSGKLKLTKDVITKLENSQFKELGAYTYVRGYLNHYTDLLGVDSEKYIELIPRTEIEVSLINTCPQLNTGIKFKRQSKSMASYMLGTFVVLVISFSGWFLIKNYSAVSSKVNKSIEVVNSLEIKPKQETLVADSNSEDSYHYSSLIPSNEQNQQHPDNNNEITIPIQGATQQQDFEEQTNDTITKLSYEVVIKATETSWVKVEDSDGNKLYNDLLKPGEIQLQSDKPLHFRIGNQNSVKMNINNQDIELSKFSRKNIADFNWPR